jgi:hypothetical protein
MIILMLIALRVAPFTGLGYLDGYFACAFYRFPDFTCPTLLESQYGVSAAQIVPMLEPAGYNIARNNVPPLHLRFQ